MAQENAIESLYRHSIEAASQFVEDQMPSMLRLAQHELMPPPLPRAEAERDQIRSSWLMLLTGLVLLAGSDLAFADAAADANAAYRRGDYAAAIELYRSLAEQGDTAAQYVLGNMYDNGEGVLRNKNEANKWWYRAALHGNADALRKFEAIRCEKLYPKGKGAIPGVNCLNDAGKNYDLLTKPDQTAPPKPTEPAAAQRAAVSAAASDQADASQTTPPGRTTQGSRLVVPLQREKGMFIVSAEIDARITLDFVVDSGAAYVTMPVDIFAKLREAGTIEDADVLGATQMRFADGSTRETIVFIIRSLRIGDKFFQDIKAATVPPYGQTLLGQTFLNHFRSWSINDAKAELILDLPQ
jgi:predicted aspartyl protease